MSPILSIQRRMMELGRIRLGDKGPKGEPRKLAQFRLTSASRGLLEAAAQAYGGTVKDWKDAPDEGYYELYTEATEFEIILPPTFSDRDGSPTTAYSQWFESWTAGGCQRRCDGEVEALSGKDCLCQAEGVDPGEGDPKKGQCRVTTRVSVILPKLPGLGVWRLESHGWYAATFLPGTLEIIRLASEGEGQFIPAVLRIEQKSVKRDGKTRRFTIPVIDLPETRIGDMLPAGRMAVNGPAPLPGRPALPAAEALPADPSFSPSESASFGAPPPLPDERPLGEASSLGDQVDALLEQAQLAGADVQAVVAAVAAKEQAGELTAEWLQRQAERLRVAEQATA